MDKNYYIQKIDFKDENTMIQSLSLLREVFNNEQFTIDWWKWKYLNSPFGEALGWSIVDRRIRKIVALRIVWRWKLKKGAKTIDAFQMVDTATSSSCRGMGFFKILTLEALKTIGNCVIFNFPNSNSAPLYIKLGWKELKNQPWLLLFSNPLYFSKSKYLSGKLENFDWELLKHYTNNMKEYWHTPWDERLLKWRFLECPNNQYYFFLYKNELIIYKIDIFKKFRIATIVYSIGQDIFAIFSHFLFTRKIVAFRYNAYNNLNYQFLSEKKLCFHIKKKFKYYSYNYFEPLELTTGETDFL